MPVGDLVSAVGDFFSHLGGGNHTRVPYGAGYVNKPCSPPPPPPTPGAPVGLVDGPQPFQAWANADWFTRNLFVGANNGFSNFITDDSNWRSLQKGFALVSAGAIMVASAGTAAEIMAGLSESGSVAALAQSAWARTMAAVGIGVRSKMFANAEDDTTYPEGTFTPLSMNYPGGPTTYGPEVPMPMAPVRLLEGQEYNTARMLANEANETIRDENALTGNSFEGMDVEIHENIPVKFGGSPTDYMNKSMLTRAEHAAVTRWWADLQRWVQQTNK